jgi:hypothetical protein
MKYSLPDPAILIFADRNAAERLQHDFWPSVLAICDRQAMSRCDGSGRCRESALSCSHPERWSDYPIAPLGYNSCGHFIERTDGSDLGGDSAAQEEIADIELEPILK